MKIEPETLLRDKIQKLPRNCAKITVINEEAKSSTITFNQDGVFNLLKLRVTEETTYIPIMEGGMEMIIGYTIHNPDFTVYCHITGFNDNDEIPKHPVSSL